MIRSVGGFESRHRIMKPVQKFEWLESASEIGKLIKRRKHKGKTHAEVSRSFIGSLPFADLYGRLGTLRVAPPLLLWSHLPVVVVLNATRVQERNKGPRSLCFCMFRLCSIHSPVVPL